MPGHGEKFEAKREAALAALLEAPTLQEAAQRVGIDPTTLRRWLARPAFRRAWRQVRRQVLESAVARLQAAAGEAVEQLVVELAGARAGDRIRAALGIIDRAMSGTELLDLAQDLEDLRALVEGEGDEQSDDADQGEGPEGEGPGPEGNGDGRGPAIPHSDLPAAQP